MASDTAASDMQANEPNYTARSFRISKENLCMVLALWMEAFPELEKKDPVAKTEHPSHRKVGAVLVLPNDMIHAVDFSRGGVHGVARLLIRHSDVAQDCKVFVSRKPCSFCAKLLVQSKIKRIFYLPIEPEYKEVEDFRDESSRVDNLFKTSPISQSVFVPTVRVDVSASADKRNQPTKPEIGTSLFDVFWNKEWMETAKDDLPWPAFDANMKSEVEGDFKKITKWMARFVIEEKNGHIFTLYRSGRKPSSLIQKKINIFLSVCRKLLTLAKFLSERSDDPKTGVGAVITNAAYAEIVALGWNGFPTKALYGEFPRASHHDDQVKEKKYPYMIHAEQNALLLRNTKNLTNGILFVTKTPCDECTPLLEMEGIKTVVLGEKLTKKKSAAGNLNYTKFYEKVKARVFTCFEMSSVTDDGDASEKETGEPLAKQARRNLQFKKGPY